jgi:pyridoxal phosphate enzyme (YggS family)
MAGMSDVASNLKIIQQKIATSLVASSRAPDAVKLVAVSKGKELADVIAAVNAGQRVFGENRVQEADRKFSDLGSRRSDLELHLIGPLQTNKAEDAVRIFDVIETLDRPRLAEALAAAIRKTARRPKLLIEVNIGTESQKAGIAPSVLPEFLQFCRTGCGLEIDGLMCIPPQSEDAATSFDRLRELAAELDLRELSMGMSADFETAIRCGATLIRIGSAIFGPRVSI